MKVLTLTQPWATLVMLGVKKYETRSWRTNYTGPLGIHAAKAFPQAEKDLCDTPPFRDALRQDHLGASDLPTGKLLGIVLVDRYYRTEDIRGQLDADELAFGDYSDFRFAWHFSRVLKQFNPPLPVRGFQRIWELDLFSVFQVTAGDPFKKA